MVLACLLGRPLPCRAIVVKSRHIDCAHVCVGGKPERVGDGLAPSALAPTHLLCRHLFFVNCLKDLIITANELSTEIEKGKWVPARPMGLLAFVIGVARLGLYSPDERMPLPGRMGNKNI